MILSPTMIGLRCHLTCSGPDAVCDFGTGAGDSHPQSFPGSQILTYKPMGCLSVLAFPQRSWEEEDGAGLEGAKGKGALVLFFLETAASPSLCSVRINPPLCFSARLCVFLLLAAKCPRSCEFCYYCPIFPNDGSEFWRHGVTCSRSLSEGRWKLERARCVGRKAEPLPRCSSQHPSPCTPGTVTSLSDSCN